MNEPREAKSLAATELPVSSAPTASTDLRDLPEHLVRLSAPMQVWDYIWHLQDEGRRLAAELKGARERAAVLSDAVDHLRWERDGARNTKRELHRAAQAAESLAANVNAETVERLDAELAQVKVERHQFRNEVKFMRFERGRLAKRIRELTTERDEARDALTSATLSPPDCGCAFEVMPGGVYPERRYFHEPDCPGSPPVSASTGLSDSDHSGGRE